MSNSKKKREEFQRRAKRELQARKRRRERSASIDASFVKPDIHHEILYITKLAQAQDSRLVTVGDLVLFSTRTRDAWLLDPEDHFALCVCDKGEPQPFRIIDTPETFGIEWTATFAIEGAAFIVHERSGRVLEMDGYPIAEISAACRDQSTRND